MERKKGKKNPSGKLFSRWANTIKLENKTFPTTQESDVDDFDGMCFLSVVLLCPFDNI